MIYPWLTSHWQVLDASFKAGRFHHAQLFTGLPGIGKHDLALEIADALLCSDKNSLMSCGHCKNCILNKAQTHPDKLVISSEGATIGVDEIRQVSEFMYHSSQQGGTKVVIVHQAHKMTNSAANALLKTLEEPSKERFLILTCDDISLLPTTIISRCARNNIAISSLQNSIDWLAAEVFETEKLAWLPLFLQQPLKVKQWFDSQQIEHVNNLFGKINNIEHDSDIDEIINIVSKYPELVSEMKLFIIKRLNARSVEGGNFLNISSAQQALSEFVRDQKQIPGLNLNLALSKLFYNLRDAL